MPFKCGVCDGKGYLPASWEGGLLRCIKCDGTGNSDRESEEKRLIQDLWQEITRLNNELSAQNISFTKERRPDDNMSPGMRCRVCNGRGWIPGPRYTSIIKCSTCNGMGKPGREDPIIERLWHEIYTLQVELGSAQFNEWEREKTTRPPPRKNNSEVKDQEIWLHILGLEGTPSQDEIKRAFKQKAQQVHPDHGGTDTSFRVVKMAHDKLVGEPR